MRDITGLVLLAGAAWLLWSAFGRRRRAMAARSRGEAPPKLHHSLTLIADIVPPLVCIGLFIAGVQVAIAFLMTDGAGGTFSRLDLAGFMLLLVAYGIWITFKSRHRVA